MRREAYNRNRFYLLSAWIMVGAMILYAAFFTYANQYKEISFSVKDNNVYDVSSELLSTGTINEGVYSLGLYVNLTHDNEHYIRVIIDGAKNNNTKLKFIVFYFDKNGTPIPTETIEDNQLQNGINDYRLVSTDFAYCEIYIYGETAIVLKGLQFRESIQSPSVIGALPLLGLTTLIYILLTTVFVTVYKTKKKNSILNNNERSVILLSIPQIEHSISAQVASVLRIVLFFQIITLSLLLIIKDGEKAYLDNFHLFLNTEVIVLLFCTLLMIDDKQSFQAIKIDKTAVLTCTSLAAYMTISDLFVSKVYRFAGAEVFITLLVFGCVWNWRKDNERFIKDFDMAVQWFLALLVLLSILIKKDAVPGRFSGPLENPSIYALFLGAIWAVLLGNLEHHIEKKHIRTIIINILELMITGGLLFAAHSITPMLAVLLISLLWGMRFLGKKKGNSYTIKATLLVGLLMISFLTGFIWLVRNTDIQFSSRIIDKLRATNITVFLSGRDYYWREYMREMNIFGHGKRPFLWFKRIYPHNALIGMMYWYGVPCIIPYTLMMIMAVEKSWRYANTGLQYAAVPFYSIVSFIIMSMADNVEQPFVWLPWIACYLMMAPILLMPVEEIEALKIKSCERNE